jgi:TonB-dependent SusC/RagA subfamily outer membrane receptor
MSLSQSRALLARVAGILTWPAFMALGACVHTPRVADAPPPERVNVSNRGVRNLPGVAISRTPTGGFGMRIISGLVRHGEPLYVVDDTPIPVDPSRGIDWFQLEDIAQIRVLKDPAEIAVYGPPGINGVILITTKRGLRQENREILRRFER